MIGEESLSGIIAGISGMSDDSLINLFVCCVRIVADQGNDARESKAARGPDHEGYSPSLFCPIPLPDEHLPGFGANTMFRPVTAPVQITGMDWSLTPSFCDLMTTYSAACVSEPLFTKGETDGCSFSSGYSSADWALQPMTQAGCYPAPFGIPNIEALTGDEFTPVRTEAEERTRVKSLFDDFCRSGHNRDKRTKTKKSNRPPSPISQRCAASAARALTSHMAPTTRRAYLDTNFGSAAYRSKYAHTAAVAAMIAGTVLLHGIARGLHIFKDPQARLDATLYYICDFVKFRGQLDTISDDFAVKERMMRSCTGVSVIMQRGPFRLHDSLVFAMRVRIVHAQDKISALAMYLPFNACMQGAFLAYPDSMHPRTAADLSKDEGPEDYPYVTISDVGWHDLLVPEFVLQALADALEHAFGIEGMADFIMQSHHGVVVHPDDRPEFGNKYHVVGDPRLRRQKWTAHLRSGWPGVTLQGCTDGLMVVLETLSHLDYNGRPASDGSVSDAEALLAGAPLSSGLQVKMTLKGENVALRFRKQDRNIAWLYMQLLRSDYSENWRLDVSDRLLGCIRKVHRSYLMRTREVTEPLAYETPRYIRDLATAGTRIYWSERDVTQRIGYELFLGLNADNSAAPVLWEMAHRVYRDTQNRELSVAMSFLPGIPPDDPFELLSHSKPDALKYIVSPDDKRIHGFLRNAIAVDPDVDWDCLMSIARVAPHVVIHGRRELVRYAMKRNDEAVQSFGKVALL